MNRKFRGKQAHPQHLKSPVGQPFKSPITTGRPKKTEQTPEEKNAQVEALKRKLADVKSEIAELDDLGYKESELQDHIDKLHEYNEIKDAASTVLGRIAVFEGVQTKDLYQRYGLELTD